MTIDCNELVSYILTRQVHQARVLVQHDQIWPRLAMFGGDNFINTLRNYFDNFYDTAKKRNLISAEFFVADDANNFTKMNADPLIQGILCGENFASALAPTKDINGARADSPFDNCEVLAKKYLVSGFNPSSEIAPKILDFDKLTAAALADNLLRACFIDHKTD